MHSKRYLHKELDVDSIRKEDTLEVQARITLLNQAPTIVSNAIKAGWMSYPTKQLPDPEEDVSGWINKYDCERAYNLRQTGMTYREIGKLLCVGIGRVSHILRHGEDIVVNRKLNALGVKPIDLPKKSTVAKLATLSKRTAKTKK